MPTPSRSARFFTSLLNQGLALWGLLLVLRVSEFTTVRGSWPHIPETAAVFAFHVLRFEAVSVGLYLIGFGVAIAIIAAFLPRVAKGVQAVAFLLIFLLYLATTQFFQTTHLLLDKVLFHFRLSEILVIVNSEVGTAVSKYLWFHLSGAVALVLFTILGLRKNGVFKGNRLKFAAIAVFAALVASSFAYPSKRALSVSTEKIALSKTGYFLASTYGSLWPKKKTVGDFDYAVSQYRKFSDLPQIPLQDEYPMISVWGRKPSQVAPYFEEFDGPPNLVVVFCEGLSSSFSGPDAEYGDMTPHLSKLYAQGLYWPNTLSNTNRTHGAFSNALASMPHGFERGPLNLKAKKYPEHLSLPKYLVKNGYDAAFLYGGWAYFDNYEPFLRMNYVDRIYGEKFFRENYNITTFTKGNSFSWGMPDKKLFNMYFNLKKDDRPTPPYLSIFLNQSLHSPFKVPDHEKYIKKARDRFAEVNPDTELFERHKDEFATISYMDEAIGEFMQAFRERPEFNNTVFVFVGDHNFYGLPLLNDLDERHVPLLIFSPKLKEAKKFRDVVAHTDIPAAMAKLFAPYLHVHRMPPFSNWMSPGLSTTDQLRATKPIFFGNFSGDIQGVVRNDTALVEGRLYVLKPHLKMELIHDKKTEKLYREVLDDYRAINRYVFENDKLLLDPDSTYLNHHASFFFPE